MENLLELLSLSHTQMKIDNTFAFVWKKDDETIFPKWYEIWNIGKKGFLYYDTVTNTYISNLLEQT